MSDVDQFVSDGAADEPRVSDVASLAQPARAVVVAVAAAAVETFGRVGRFLLRVAEPADGQVGARQDVGAPEVVSAFWVGAGGFGVGADVVVPVVSAVAADQLLIGRYQAVAAADRPLFSRQYLPSAALS